MSLLRVVISLSQYVCPKPLLIFLTLPATLVTFGLFLAGHQRQLLSLIAGRSLLTDFQVSGFWTALIFSILLVSFSVPISFPSSKMKKKLAEIEAV